MAVVTLPDGYGYVLLAASSTFFVNLLHSILTSRKRKAAGIKYPITYASAEQADKDPKAYAFNCAQRAHANFTENLTPYLGGLLIAGLKYPVLAGGLGAAWSLSRVSFALGYANKGPQARTTGGIPATLISFTLNLLAVYTGVSFALNW